MFRTIKRISRNALRKSGRELTVFPLPKYLKQHRVDCILDIGANVGQYGAEVRQLGYKGRIISFEPLSEAFLKLTELSNSDSNWTVHNIGIGSTEENLNINIAAATSTSSFLPLRDSEVADKNNLKYTDTESVKVQRLDTIYNEVVGDAKSVFMKIDTQGFEYKVLEGAEESLKSIAGIQIEVSLSKIYEGEAYIEEIIAYLRTRNFTPYWVQHGFKDPLKMQLLQADLFFFSDQ